MACGDAASLLLALLVSLAPLVKRALTSCVVAPTVDVDVDDDVIASAADRSCVSCDCASVVCGAVKPSPLMIALQ